MVEQNKVKSDDQSLDLIKVKTKPKNPLKSQASASKRKENDFSNSSLTNDQQLQVQVPRSDCKMISERKDCTSPAGFQVVYQIETVFVMDEEPFKHQRIAVAGRQKASQLINSDNNFVQSDQQRIPASIIPTPSAAEDQSRIAEQKSKFPAEMIKLSATMGQDAQSATKTKDRTNSSIIPASGTFTATKAVKSKVSRKISHDQVTQEDTTIQQQVKETAKNLLTEFEKDETLEPGTTLMLDSKFQVSQQHISGSENQTTKGAKTAGGQAAATKTTKVDQQTTTQNERESYQKRSDWRATEQIQRKHAKQYVRNQDKKPHVIEETSASTNQQINLQNMRDHQQNDIVVDESPSEAASKPQQSPMKEETTEQKPSPRRQGLLEKFVAEDFFEGQPQLRIRFTEVVRKFNHELMKSTCQVMKGCKSWKAKQIANSVFELLNEILQHTQDTSAFMNSTSPDQVQSDQATNNCKNKGEQKSSAEKHKSIISFKSQEDSSNLQDGSCSKQVHVVKQITTSVSTLKRILNYCFAMNNYQKPDCLKDFLVASLLMQSKINVIVLLAGTSGTGKSTLASLLGTRLGISTVLSTDSVRHVMRNFLKEQDNPTLFCSTYEAGNTVSEDIRQNASESWVTLKGYKQQCSLVTKELAKVIDSFYQRNESLVVEGVHLTPSFLKEMMTKYPTCIPFVLYIKNKNKHGERFAVRAKHMTIDPRFNKYISNIQHIRTIQEYLLKKSEEILIPRIENHNVDRSVSLIQTTIMRCLHRISEGHVIYDTQQKRATGIHKVFQSIHKNQLSSKQAQGLIHQKVDRFKMVESFLQSANHKADFDPDIERKLTSYRLSASFEALPVNIWERGEFADEANQTNNDDEEVKRSKSITSLLPQITEASTTKDESGTAPNYNSSATGYYKLSKAEKKQIKRDLMEFAKKSQGLNKESQLRKNLIETEEDIEAKICEGSQARTILNDHRKKQEKMLGFVNLDAKQEEKSQQPQSVIETNVVAATLVNLTHGNSSVPEKDQNEVKTFSEQDEQLKSLELIKQCSVASDEGFVQNEIEKKVQEKRLMSDKQKENELILLKEAQLRAQQQIQKEESQQITEELKETMQKSKRNKSQEPAGVGDQEKNSDGGFDNSQGSLEVMADDEDDQERLREVSEADGELIFQMSILDQQNHSKQHPLPVMKNQKHLLFQQQKQVLENMGQINLLDLSEKQTKNESGSAQNHHQMGGGAGQPKKLKGFEYKLETLQNGSADNLIRAAQQQQTTQSSKEHHQQNKKSGFASNANRHEGAGQRAPRIEAPTAFEETKTNRNTKRLKPKVEKDNKRQSSHQQDQHSKFASTSAQARNKQQSSAKQQSNVNQQKQSSKVGGVGQGGPDCDANEEEKKKHIKASYIRQSIEKRSLTSGSNHIYSTRGDAHSLSDKHQQAASGSEQDATSVQAEKQTSAARKVAKLQALGQTSNDDGQSGFGDINKTIEEEDSEYSQTIGSLVSYTINYMEKNTIRGGGGQSSRHGGDRINEVQHSDSDSDGDHSLLAEKEDSHSDIDTIEEEVDLSSEGSDHENEDHQEEQIARENSTSHQHPDQSTNKQSTTDSSIPQTQQQQLNKPQSSQSVQVLEETVVEASAAASIQAQAESEIATTNIKRDSASPDNNNKHCNSGDGDHNSDSRVQQRIDDRKPATGTTQC